VTYLLDTNAISALMRADARIHAKAALTPEMALRIEKAFGPDMSHLLRMQLAYDVAKTRQHARDIAVKRYVPA
jgi:addiction module HigA family antidote